MGPFVDEVYTHDRGHIARGTHTEGLRVGQVDVVVDGWSIGTERERALSQPSRFILPVAAATAFNLFPRFRFSVHPRRISDVDACTARLLGNLELCRFGRGLIDPLLPLWAITPVEIVLWSIQRWMDERDNRDDFWLLLLLLLLLWIKNYQFVAWYFITSDKMLQGNRIFTRTKVRGFSRVP